MASINLRGDYRALNTKYVRHSTRKGRIQFHKRLQQAGLEFLHKQKGLFTEMVGAEDYYFHNGKWPDLKQHLRVSNFDKNSLIKIELEGKEEIAKVNSILNNMGINNYCLMPTYDNVAKSISFIR